MRGRAVDALTRESLLTPEEREARRLAEEEQMRAYEELRRRQRAEIDVQFHDAYNTYTTNGYNINYDEFFNPPAMNPTPPSLNERYNAAMQEVNRCAQRNDHQGQLTAMQTARRLRQEITRSSSVSMRYQSFI